MRFAALVLAAVVLATPALAQTDPTPPAPAPATASEPQAAGGASQPADQAAEQPAQQEEQICRTVQRAESRLRNRRERICGTRSQWEAMQDQNARDMNRVGSVQSMPNN